MMRSKRINPKKIERELYKKLEERKPKDVPISNDGKIVETQNNVVDALRHSYASGIYTMDWGKTAAKIAGNFNELRFNNPEDSKNMDLWNNAVGRKYGELAKNDDELLDMLLLALKNGELITHSSDPRKYSDDSFLDKLSSDKVIVVEESKTGENLIFYDPRRGIMTRLEFIAAIKEGQYPTYEIRIINQKEIPVSKKDGYFNNLD